MKHPLMTVKPYRLVARIKNNRLWSAITRQWPDVHTQKDAAARMKVPYATLSALLNITRWPWSAKRNDWTGLAHRVAATLRETPDYLFDPVLYGRRARSLDLEVDQPALEAAGLLALPEAPDVAFDRKEQCEFLGLAIALLKPREQQVIRRRFGLDGEEEWSFSEVGDELHISKERVRQIEAKALRRLRHPSRGRELREFAR